MKKIVVVLFGIMVIMLIINGDKNVVIPQDAIRFRIIANSDNFSDQAKKIEIKQELEPIISNILSSATNKIETKNLIDYNMPKITDSIEKFEKNYDINYGLNYFPEKEYKGITYPAGEYESLVVTLGDGLGENWWCVLFPPLCLLEASSDNYDDYTYSFYIKDIINQYF